MSPACSGHATTSQSPSIPMSMPPCSAGIPLGRGAGHRPTRLHHRRHRSRRKRKLVHGQLLHGLLHPEMGHIMVPPPSDSSAVQPICHCPFHKSCVEGYISGAALAVRWGVKADALPEGAPRMGRSRRCHGPCPRQYHPHPLPTPHHPRRWRHEPGTHPPAHPWEILQSPQQLPPRPRNRSRPRRLHPPPGLKDQSGILGALALGGYALQGRRW